MIDNETSFPKTAGLERPNDVKVSNCRSHDTLFNNEQNQYSRNSHVCSVKTC